MTLIYRLLHYTLLKERFQTNFVQYIFLIIYFLRVTYWLGHMFHIVLPFQSERKRKKMSERIFRHVLIEASTLMCNLSKGNSPGRNELPKLSCENITLCFALCAIALCAVLPCSTKILTCETQGGKMQHYTQKSMNYSVRFISI